MAITQTFCSSYRLEQLQGTHAVGTDTFKMALYTSAASLGADTTAYSTSGEASGSGYSAGGKTLVASTGYPQLVTLAANDIRAAMQFDSLTWASSTITARGALIYNASKSNKAVCVLSFGIDQASDGSDFTVRLDLLPRPLIML
jgi:hypothetical protein